MLTLSFSLTAKLSIAKKAGKSRSWYILCTKAREIPHIFKLSNLSRPT